MEKGGEKSRYSGILKKTVSALDVGKTVKLIILRERKGASPLQPGGALIRGLERGLVYSKHASSVSLVGFLKNQALSPLGWLRGLQGCQNGLKTKTYLLER